MGRHKSIFVLEVGQKPHINAKRDEPRVLLNGRPLGRDFSGLTRAQIRREMQYLRQRPQELRALARRMGYPV